MLRCYYELSDATFMSLSYQFNDDRTDSVYNPATYQNDDYQFKIL